jgi:hypothetical protein
MVAENFAVKQTEALRISVTACACGDGASSRYVPRGSTNFASALEWCAIVESDVVAGQALHVRPHPSTWVTGSECRHRTNLSYKKGDRFESVQILLREKYSGRAAVVLETAVCGDSIRNGREVDLCNRFGDVDGLRERAYRFCRGEGDGVGEARQQRSAQCQQPGAAEMRFVESCEASRVRGTEHIAIRSINVSWVCARSERTRISW